MLDTLFCITPQLCVQTRGNIMILTLLIKLNFNDKPTIQNYESSLVYAALFLLHNNCFSLTLPPIGMNRDNIPVPMGAHLIYKHFILNNINIRICATDLLYNQLVHAFDEIYWQHNNSRIY